jgi:hypothetical protein
MSLQVARWKLAGVAVGTMALAGTSTAAYACLPDTTGATPLHHSVLGTNTDLHADDADTALAHARVLAWEENALAEATAAVAALQAKADAVGSPSTISPRTAWKLKGALAFVAFLQARLAALPAADQAKVDALQASLATLKTRLSAILANANVVAPTVKAVEFTKPMTHFRFFTARRAGTRHHCDGDGFHWFGSGTRDFRDYRHHDGSWQH